MSDTACPFCGLMHGVLECPRAQLSPNVTPLRVVEPAPEINSDIIAQLEYLLVEARKGNIDDCSIAWSDRANYVRSWYIGSPTRCIGQIEYLKFRICTTMRETALQDAPGR